MKEASKIENKSDVFFVNLTTETVTPSVDSRKNRKMGKDKNI